MGSLIKKEKMVVLYFQSILAAVSSIIILSEPLSKIKSSEKWMIVQRFYHQPETGLLDASNQAKETNETKLRNQDHIF